MLSNRRIISTAILLVIGTYAYRSASADCCEFTTPTDTCNDAIDQATCLSQGGVWNPGFVCDGTGCFKRIYVKAAHGGTETGEDWSTPFSTIYSALANIAPAPVRTEIWVAQGTYLVDSGPLSLSNDVDIIGGFFGEPGQENQRAAGEFLPSDNLTLISGVLSGTNASILVQSQGSNLEASLESLTLTGATQSAIVISNNSQAQFLNLLIENNGGAASDSNGAGANIANSSPTFTNCIFRHNEVGQDTGFSVGTGGAVAVSTFFGIEAAMLFQNCRFENNAAEFQGGAVHTNNSAAPEYRNCEFVNNTAGGGFGGGGAIFQSGFTSTVTMIARDCSFIGNACTGGAAGAIDYQAVVQTPGPRAQLVNCVFRDNQADGEGGALRTVGGNSGMQIVNCSFEGNRSSGAGGGVAVNDGPMTFTNCVFSGNVAQTPNSLNSVGGGLAHFGGVLDVTNCTFSRNVATGTTTTGGGLFSSFAFSSVGISNSIFWGNEANGFIVEAAQLDVVDSMNVTVANCCIQNLDAFAGNGNIGGNPGFVDESGADLMPGTGDEDLSLRAGSPCIDAGDLAVVPDDNLDADADGVTTGVGGEKTPDISLNVRLAATDVASLTGVCGSVAVDIGAFEATSLDCDNNGQLDADEIDADSGLDTNGDGILDACQDCDNNGILDPVDVAGGAIDCNNNCIPDNCETDCDGNGTIDDCQTLTLPEDCNLNGIPDSCEVDVGNPEAIDCNANGIPDDCELNDCDFDGIPDDCDVDGP